MKIPHALRTSLPKAWKTRLVVSLCLASFCRPLWAHDRMPSVPTDRTAIAGSVLSGARGVVGVNEAAGTGNAQVNSVAIGSGKTTASVRQSVAGGWGASGTGSAAIGGQAFSAFAGILSVNQVSGNHNAQANTVAVSRNWQPLPSQALGEVAAHVSQDRLARSDAPVKGRATISPDAFKGATGVVQVSQVVGAANRVANHVSLNISVGAVPSG